MGIINPKIMSNFNLNYTGSYLELSVNKLIEHIK